MGTRRTNKHYNKNPARRKMATGPGGANQTTKPVPINVTGAATVSTTHIELTFDQPVILNSTSLPKWTFPGATGTPKVISGSLSDAVTGEFFTDTSIAGATTMRVPFEDPYVRNISAGYLNPGSVTI